MKRFSTALLATAAALASALSVPFLFGQGSAPQSSHTLAVPTVGFIPAANGTSLTPIIGIPGAARLGAAIPVAGSTALYVAPRGAYLLASAAGANVSLASLRPAALQFGLEQNVIPAALVAPDLVVFSPNGATAALYSKQTSTVQVLMGLPSSPHVGHSYSVAAPLLQIAVSDDGEATLAQEESGGIVALNGGAPLYKASSAAAIIFLPASHDAAIADTAANSVIELKASGGTAVLGSGLTAPASLAVTVDGSTILAASASHKGVWALNRSAGKAQDYALPDTVKGLQAIAARDTFLVLYQGGHYGLLSWHDNHLATYFVGAFRSGVN